MIRCCSGLPRTTCWYCRRRAAKSPAPTRLAWINGQLLHAMCALDALSVGPMFNTASTVKSRCHLCGAPIEVRMQGGTVVSASPGQPWAGIRWQGTSGCAARSLCLDMVFLRDRETAGEWRVQDRDNISILDLSSAVAMGAAFLCPLLELAVPIDWRALLHDYDLLAGRLWVLVLAWLALSPYVFYRLTGRGGSR